jgi:hypothetical protein
VIGSASPETWALFFRAERCALAVQGALRAWDGRDGLTLTTTTRDAVLRHVLDESRAALSGRAQLQQLSEAATRSGWRVILLKGGAAIAEGKHVQLSDLDILVGADDLEAITAWLNDTGYQDSGLAPSVQHLPLRIAREALPIEIHTRLTCFHDVAAVRARAIPMPALPGLWRLSPADHCWHTLAHAVLQHPERRGRLRELFLLADAMNVCEADGTLAQVQTEMHAHERRDVLMRMCAMADALRTERPIVDAFAMASLRKYVFFRRYANRSTYFRVRAARIIGGEVSFTGAIADDLRVTHDVPSTSATVNWLAHRVPWLGRGVRLALRVIRTAASASVAAANAWETRRLLRAHASRR